MNPRTPHPIRHRSLTLHPIGTIATPYSDKYEAPRQPGALHEDVVGTITLFPRRNFEQALDDLSGFEWIWILGWFDRAGSWKAKVLPPRGRAKRGVFATRSPHRPNPIGLSLCRLLEVKGRIIRVANPDLLDGTPILDLKPYVPAVEAHADARAGWLEGLSGNRFTVVFSATGNEQLTWLATEHAIDLRAHILRVLGHDPRPHPYRRVKNNGDGTATLAIRSWRVRFVVEETTVTVLSVASGYSREEAASGTHLHNASAHRAFHQRWPQGSGSTRADSV